MTLTAPNNPNICAGCAQLLEDTSPMNLLLEVEPEQSPQEQLPVEPPANPAHQLPSQSIASGWKN